MQKFFVNSNQIKKEEISILGDDVKHMVNVLRVTNGEKILICNKENHKSYLAVIENVNKNSVDCKIEKEIEETTELKFKLDVFQGLPKAEKMELIIQKLTEIGVTKFIPIKMERCVVKLQSKDEAKKIERWQKIAEVASKQSKRDIIPTVNNVEDIAKICEKIGQYDIFIVAYEEEKNKTLKDVLKQEKEKIKDGKIAILVGPEGGISKKEIDMLAKNGAKIITLGSRILRTETAPIVLASNIVYELDM